MPNIAITKYCNLKCPYCFAEDMIAEEQTKAITLDQLTKILNWLGQEPLSGHIGIIGGEPTLHPQYKDVIYLINDFCARNNIKSLLFTNGIELYKTLHLLPDNMNILININKLNDINQSKLNKTLDLCHKLHLLEENRVCIGCNLYSTNTDYSYFWNVVDTYHEISTVRMSITAPIQINDKQDKFLYYQKMKPILFDFLNKAKQYNLEVTFDCNQIPLCELTENEQLFVKSFGRYKTFCSPTIDITADFKASSCFGSYDDTLIDCNLFNNINELERYFQYKIFKKTELNYNGKCKNCEKFNLQQCQGGCLSFSKQA